MNLAVWALLEYYSHTLFPVPGPAYWFRNRLDAQHFAANNNAIYPHLPALMPARFPVWPRGMCHFNQATYMGPIIILRMDEDWWAVRPWQAVDPNILRIWRQPLILA